MKTDRTAGPRRACATRRAPLRLLSALSAIGKSLSANGKSLSANGKSLAAIGKLLTQRVFFRFAGCNLAMADLWNVRPGGELSTEGGAERIEELFPWPTEVHFSGTSDWLGFQKHKWRLDAG
jgi:hypothetical protein